MTILNEDTISRIREDLFWPKVQKTETCWLWTAGRLTEDYGAFHINRRPYLAHRVSYALAYGPIPEGIKVDHKCHNTMCVRPSHLREATHKQNQENLGKLMGSNTSGYRGVSFKKSRGKWLGTVGHNGKIHYVGLFATPEEANTAVIAKRNELFTHNDLDRPKVVSESPACLCGCGDDRESVIRQIMWERKWDYAQAAEALDKANADRSAK